MATIALYAGKINQMPELLKEAKKSVTDYKSELAALKAKTLTINRSICNLDDVINAIQASTQTQEEKINSLEVFQQNSEKFISDVIQTDSKVADIVNQRKDNFYEEYHYLKPECEKNGWEKIKDGCKSVGEWCKENWEAIGKILITVTIVAVLGVAAALTGGIIAVIATGAFWGALSGAVIGGITSGVASVRQGGSFLDGFADGALGGAVTGGITGAVFAGIGVAGAALGNYLGGSCNFVKYSGTILNVLKNTSKITGVLTLGMGGFDMLCMVAGLFNPDSPLAAINEKLHSNSFYNGFQMAVSTLAVFSGGAYLGMLNRVLKGPPVCFVAGTMILTACGLVAIENIKAGDKVIATNPDTFETAEKKVVETYIRETPGLVHLTINEEQITTTANHPFYVKDRGFVNAGELQVGDKVLSADGNVYFVEKSYIEILKKPEKVYNFQVEDFHTYHVGKTRVLVHNADYESGINSSNPFYKQGGGSNLDDFMTPHAQKHAYNPNIKSTKNKTQFGENIDVAKLREDTMLHPDKVIYDSEHNMIKYVKEYDFNISTADTPTGSHRVFINLAPKAGKTNRNSQFPYYGGDK